MQIGIGWDLAGVIDTIGPGVDRFRPADPVIGMRDLLSAPIGAQAEYVALIGISALDAVRDGGSFVSVAAGAAPTPLRGTRVHNVWIRTDARRLAELAALVDAGRLTTRVAATQPLDTVAAAHKRHAAGGLRGRIVLQPQGGA